MRRQPPGGWPVPPEVDLHRWVDQAACADRPDLPWITDTNQVDARQRAAMGVICAGCPVLTRCQETADRVDATAGYWAGTPRDARILEPAQEPAPVAVVVWVPHQTQRTAGAASAHTWEQAAITWPKPSAVGGGAA